MVESVSNHLPSPKVGVMDKVSQEKLQNPGAYSRDYYPTPIFPEERRQDRGSFLGFIGKLILGVVIVGAAAVGLRRYVPAFNKIDVKQELVKDAKSWEKIKYDFARFADWIERNTISRFKKKP